MDGFYEALDALLGAPGWAWGVAGIALAFLLRSMLHGLLSRPRRRTSASWQRDADVSSRELQRSVARLESENAAFSNFFLLLPDFTKEINSRMERREVGPLLFKIIERLFEPSQILMFTVEKKIDEMVLQEYKGVGRDITRGFRVAIGEGRSQGVVGALPVQNRVVRADGSWTGPLRGDQRRRRDQAL
jgi:hypothetical protein